MDDLISRRDAIEVVNAVLAVTGDKNIAKVWDQIKDLPSAQPEQRWIPVTERLPELRRSVILSTKKWTGEGCCWEMIEHYVIWKGYRWNATYRDGEVIAWMPLPEPYRGEEQDE